MYQLPTDLSFDDRRALSALWGYMLQCCPEPGSPPLNNEAKVRLIKRAEKSVREARSSKLGRRGCALIAYIEPNPNKEDGYAACAALFEEAFKAKRFVSELERRTQVARYSMYSSPRRPYPGGSGGGGMAI